MRLKSLLILLLAGCALLAFRNREHLAANVFADYEAGIIVKNLPDRQRIELIAAQTISCQRDIAGGKAYTMALPEAGSFCGCKMGGLSLFLSKREFLRGEFDNIQRYVEHRLKIQEIAARCAREAVVSL